MPDRSNSKSYSGLVQADLGIVAALGLWSVASASGMVEWSIGRVALGLVAVLFAPGYAIVSALFPTKKATADRFSGNEWNFAREEGTVSDVERLVLAVGLSVCVVPLLGIGLYYTPWAIRPSLFLSVIGALTVLVTVVAAVRRWRAPTRERYSPRLLGRLLGVGDRIGRLRTRSTMSILLTVGLVVAASGIGFAALSADRGEQFTEFYIVTEDQTGEYVAGGYPEEIPRGETGRVQVGITNQEGETTTYTVVALLESVGTNGQVQEVRRLDTFTVTVPQGEQVIRSHTIRPTMTGEDLRVTYLLYRGSPPEDAAPNAGNAYRTVHFWIDVPAS